MNFLKKCNCGLLPKLKLNNDRREKKEVWEKKEIKKLFCF